MLGTALRQQKTNPPARADALADIVLPDQDDNPVRLADLWHEGPAVLIWLRHYG